MSPFLPRVSSNSSPRLAITPRLRGVDGANAARTRATALRIACLLVAGLWLLGSTALPTARNTVDAAQRVEPRNFLGGLPSSGSDAVAGRPHMASGAAAGKGQSPGHALPLATSGGYRLVAQWPDPNVEVDAGRFNQPTGLDVAADGTVAVADSGNQRVQLFDSAGKYLTSVGERGGAVPMLRPIDVAFDATRLYVTDSGQSRILVIDRATLSLESSWADVAAPWGIAVGGDGRIYVTDRQAGEIIVLNRDGVRQATVGRAGTRDGELRNPGGLFVAADGTIYVADTGNNRVQILSSTGRSQDSLVPSRLNAFLTAPPEDVAADGQGNVFVVSANGLIWLTKGLTREFTMKQVTPLPGGKALALQPRFGLYVLRSDVRTMVAEVVRYPYLARDTAPDLRFGSYGGAVELRGVQRVSAMPGGNLALISAPGGTRHAANGAFLGVIDGTATASELAFMPDGDVLSADLTSVLRLGPRGVVRWRWQAQPLQSGPIAERPLVWITGLAYNPVLDRVYVIDIGSSQYVELSGDGVELVRTPLGDASSLTLYRDLVLSDKGELVLVNQTSRQVEFRGPDWSLKRTIVPQGIPMRVAMLGDVTFVLTRDNYVWRYAADGTLQTVWNGAPSGRATDVEAIGDRVYTVDAKVNQVLVWQADAAMAPEAPPTAPESVRCAVGVDKTASPDVLLLGETTDVTLKLGGTCPDIPPQADIVVVIDRSGSMIADAKIDAAKRAAQAFLAAVDYTQSQAAVVSFNNDATLEQPLTTDPAALDQAVAQIVANGGTNIGAAVETAAAELASPRRRSSALGVIILLTDGNSDARQALAAAFEARLDGTRLFSIGLGSDVNASLLTFMASSPKDYYFAPGNAELSGIYADIARRLRADVLMRSLTLTDELPANMRFVKMLSGPDPIQSGQVLTWMLTDIPFTGLELRYRVLPIEVGKWPTNVAAVADFVDGLGGRGRSVFPVPLVTVLEPFRTATPTPTPLPTATPTPTPTVNPKLLRAYLPLILWQPCAPTAQHADVVVVVDTSNSMLEATRAGRTKLEAAIAAASLFVSLLDLPADQAAIVSFNHSAGLAQPLSSDRGLLLGALQGLSSESGTRIDLGLDVAAAELASARHRPTSNPVIVLLTDGRPSGVTSDVVLASADRARALGATLFAIGLGSDLDSDLLKAIARDERRYFQAPDGDDLERIYRSIAYAIPCR